MTLAGARLLLTTDAVGGVWTYTLDLAEGLVGSGIAARIAVLGPALRPDQRDDVAQRKLDMIELHRPLEWLAARALASAIRTLIDDRAVRRALGEASRSHAGRYTLAALVAATVAAYARCLARRAVALSA